MFVTLLTSPAISIVEKLIRERHLFAYDVSTLIARYSCMSGVTTYTTFHIASSIKALDDHIYLLRMITLHRRLTPTRRRASHKKVLGEAIRGGA